MQPDNQDLNNIDLNIGETPELSMEGNDKPQKSIKKSKKSNKEKGKRKAPRQKWSTKKKVIVWTIVILLLAGAGVGGFFLYKHFNPDKQPESSAQNTPAEKPKYYSTLSGEEIASADLNSSPTFCMQIPNGLDGARPQVGLSEAPVVFEAIAEAGITRFAAIFQNPTSSAIGPIRSLRQYYLEWDTPFDCTIVHAGGSDEAIDSLAAGNYRDLSEDYTYEWRDYSAYIAPNNLFTSASLLKKFNSDHNYTTSEVKSFTRLKPEEAEKSRTKALEDSKEKTTTNAAGDEVTTPGIPLVTNISVNFGYTASFNTRYVYDPDSNTYLRSYADGIPHETFTCPEGLEDPAPQNDCGKATQVAPKAIAVLEVNQHLDTDGYHLVTQTTGSGTAYIFQNGTATEATWSRQSYSDPIKFTNKEDQEIAIVPGQLWVAAIPTSTGSVDY
ncbi:DUF3048 domain-containing protein [Candidatus Saccharibacteria bacterium]|nr:DUF3048 domain-containing protein [Candidatus Saccharibacteria bacterium]